MDDEEFLKLFEEETKKAEKKRIYTEYGKLGGRPKVAEKKIKDFNIRLTENQHKKLLDLSEQCGVKPQDYIRQIIENGTPPDEERNKIFSTILLNFKRLGNHFRSNVWNDEEKEQFKKLLREIILEIRQKI